MNTDATHTPQGAAFTDLILQVFRLNGQLLVEGDRLTEPLGLTSARWQVLGALQTEGRPLTVAQIGRRMGVSRQNVQRIANDLEDLGFVTFEDNPDHKRSRNIVLTPASVATLEKLDAVQGHWANVMAETMREADLRRAVEVIAMIADRCEELKTD